MPLNKIDLPAADLNKVCQQVEESIGLDTSGAILASAKTGEGIDEILEAVVERIPAPEADSSLALRALIFDSWFDPYQGVVFLVREQDGEELKKGDRIKFMSNDLEYETDEAGSVLCFATNLQTLSAGEVGFVISDG